MPEEGLSVLQALVERESVQASKPGQQPLFSAFVENILAFPAEVEADTAPRFALSNRAYEKRVGIRILPGTKELLTAAAMDGNLRGLPRFDRV